MILSVYEKKRLDRLKEKNIVIEELYINPERISKKYLIRASDGKMRDNIINNILVEKRYFYNNKFLKRQTKFNKKMYFTIIDYNDPDELVRCPNCGNKGKIVDMIDGCPYCSTDFNYGINNYRVMKKDPLNYLFDLSFWKYIIPRIFLLTLIVVVICVENNFSFFDILFVLLIFIPGTFLWMCSNYFIKICIEANNYEKIRKENQKKIWGTGEAENKFYQNLYTELINYLFTKEKELIDFDILEYGRIEKNNNEITIIINLRKVYFLKEEIISEENLYSVTMLKNMKYKNIRDNDILECSGCGASVDITMKECEYCHKINNIKNEWILEKIEKCINEKSDKNKSC